MIPSTKAVLIGLHGQVVIRDERGGQVCLTPELARQIAQELPSIAGQAEWVASMGDDDDDEPDPSHSAPLIHQPERVFISLN